MKRRATSVLAITSGLALAASLTVATGSAAQAASGGGSPAQDSGPLSGHLEPFVYPADFADSMPRIIRQPRVEGRQLSIEAALIPWRTATTHTWARPDNVQIQVRIAKAGRLIREVSLAPWQERTRLAFQGRSQRQVVERAGEYTLRLRLPDQLAAKLRNLTPRQLQERVSVVVKHRKDVTTADGLETLMTVESETNPRRADRVAPANSNPTYTYAIGNGTPFTLYGNMAGTNCMSGISTTDYTLQAGGVVYTYAEPNLNTGVANSESLWESLATGVVQDITSTAESNANTFLSDVEQGSTSGMASAAGSFAVTFLKDVIKDITQNACSNTNQPSTWTMSWTVTDIMSDDSYAATPSPYNQGAWNLYSQTDSQMDGSNWGNAVSVPTTDPIPYNQLQGYPGAQASAQWVWNGSNITMDGTGASMFAGGLAAMTNSSGYDGSSGDWLATMLTFENTADFTYGPVSSTSPTAQLSASGSGYDLQCYVPSGTELFLPFPGSTATSFSDPPEGASWTGKMTASFAENSGSGWEWIDNAQGTPETITAGFDPSADLFIQIPQYSASSTYACSMGSAVQVPTSTEVTGSTVQANLQWVQWPGMVAEAPAP